MWVLILHLFFPFKTKIMVLCFGHFVSIYLPELSQCLVVKKKLPFAFKIEPIFKTAARHLDWMK